MATQYPASSNYANYSQQPPQQCAPSPPQQYAPPPPQQYAPSPHPLPPQAQYPQYAPAPIPIDATDHIPGTQTSYAAYAQQPAEISLPAPAPYAPAPADYSGYGQESSYAPPDSSTSYKFPPVDTSYSPRAPSLPATSFDYGNSTASASPYSWTPAAPNYTNEFQLPRSSSDSSYSYNSSYTPGFTDGYNKWGYEQAAPDAVGAVPPPRQASSYGGQVDAYKSSYAEEGIYAYDGGNSQPYGSRGTGSTRWSNSDSGALSSLPKLAKALPKVETESKTGGIQRYHVKILSDSGGLPQNVICQIGLDGVRLLEPNGVNRILRIYPLETITKWEVNESSVFTFWAKSSVDFEQRKTRMQSSSSTTNAILDTLTAACVQLCEMVGEDSNKNSTASSSAAEAQKKGAFDWMMRPKPAVEEEKEHWVPDQAVTKCTACASEFGAFLRRHHCRNCGDIFCDKCTRGRIALTSEEDAQLVRVCDRCLAEVTQRTSNAKDNNNSKLVPQRTHEDLAKALQDELKRNNALRKTSSGSAPKTNDKSDGQQTLLNCTNCKAISIVAANNTRCPSCGTDSRNGATTKSSRRSGGRMREVACPICTVHLEVEAPTSGSETVECGVCQHPFLVSA